MTRPAKCSCSAKTITTRQVLQPCGCVIAELCSRCGELPVRAKLFHGPAGIARHECGREAPITVWRVVREDV